MALFEKQGIKNEKEEKNLHPEEQEEKLPLDDDLLGSVAGGVGGNSSFGDRPILGTHKF